MPQPQQLPGPNADIWDWQMHGLCRGVDSSVFFHPDGERGRARAQREMRAKEMCRSCPVITQCRSHALAVGEPYGIWGGLSESEREMLLKRGIRRASCLSARLRQVALCGSGEAAPGACGPSTIPIRPT
jgi:WhiB family redox-sensing transcriptional regulator